jgi:hypothetical protein
MEGRAVRIRVDHNVGELAAALQRAPAIVMQEVDRGAGRGALALGRTARDLAPKATSELAGSITTVRIRQGEHMVQARKAHAGPMEIGRRPGGPMPPIQPLIDWIRARKIQPKGDGVETERDLAFVIGRKIARDGTAAQPFMGPALEASQDTLRATMAAASQAGVRRAFA